ncbi:MAG TPA: imidazolonepropionase [Solirubrobacteraceae bacterium]|nr:imidazolonepropionase [Solirubrobacteraceae bacterium]
MAAVSIHSAAQVLLPPAPGLANLRRPSDLTVEPGGIALHAGTIAGLEPDSGAPVQVDGSGCAIVPGFVDCHTHLPFAGWRADEYAMKVTGVPYEEIARRGGGIAASARALAAATDDEVVAQARVLAAEMLAHGTTAFECKSGYGLSVEGELRSLALAERLGDEVEQATTSTALLAHAVPDGYDADGWMDELEELVPRTRASALDIYVESIAFGNEHLERMGELARTHGRDLRAHVEQFARHGSVPVAVAAGARSVDHLAECARGDVEALAAAECAAVLLPGAELLGAERTAPGRDLLDAGALCALGTDCNPGTSPVVSLPLVVGLAVRRYGWTPVEALGAVTLNAAWVLRLSDRIGSLEPGKRADVVLLDGPVEHVPYRFGHNPVAAVWVGGRLAWVRPDQQWRIAAA